MHMRRTMHSVLGGSDQYAISSVSGKSCFVDTVGKKALQDFHPGGRVSPFARNEYAELPGSSSVFPRFYPFAV